MLGMITVILDIRYTLADISDKLVTDDRQDIRSANNIGDIKDVVPTLHTELFNKNNYNLEDTVIDYSFIVNKLEFAKEKKTVYIRPYVKTFLSILQGFNVILWADNEDDIFIAKNVINPMMGGKATIYTSNETNESLRKYHTRRSAPTNDFIYISHAPEINALSFPARNCVIVLPFNIGVEKSYADPSIYDMIRDGFFFKMLAERQFDIL